MFNTISPLSYDLDTEYRNRQQAIRITNNNHNIFAQIAQAVPQSATFMAIIISIFFLTMTATPASAQNMVDPGQGGDEGGGNTLYIYLRGFVSQFQDENYQAARDYVDQSISADPFFVPAYVGRSAIFFLEENYDLALADAQMAYTFYPEETAIYFVMAQAQFALEDYEAATEAYTIYLDMVDDRGEEPLLLSLMYGEGMTLEMTVENLTLCAEALDQ